MGNVHSGSERTLVRTIRTIKNGNVVKDTTFDAFKAKEICEMCKKGSAKCTLVDFLRLGKHLLLIGRATEQRRNVDSRPKEDRESNEKHERSEACEECRPAIKFVKSDF